MSIVFEKDGVLRDMDDNSSLITRMTREDFGKLKAGGIVAGGMLPKIENAFKAIDEGVRSVVIKNSDNIANDRQTTIC